MKKILSLILALTCVFSLASCTTGQTTCTAHKDYNGDGYYCDLCGAIYICPDHSDADEDGACETCGAAYECLGHQDANKDGKCDRCKAPYVCSGHKDINGVGRCDICNAKFVCSHEDKEGDGKCDLCLSHFTCPEHKDYNADGFCDFCYGMLDCGDTAHRDVDANSLCDICGKPYACVGYIDADEDGECDDCGATEIAHAQAVNPDSISGFMRAFANSAPTKVESKTVRTVGRGDSFYTLTSTSTLLAGTIAGKSAAIYEEINQQLRDVESGAGITEESVFETVETKQEFLQGQGLRKTQNGRIGNWNSKGKNFAPTKGSIALILTNATVKEVSFTAEGNTHTMQFKVTKANVDKVFGQVDDESIIDASSDVSVVITSDGTTITSVLITYVVAATKDIPYQTVSIEVKYDYAVQVFSIN